LHIFVLNFSGLFFRALLQMCGKGYTLPEAVRFLIGLYLFGEIDLQLSDSINRCDDISAGLLTFSLSA
jgi:hypothetical protein